MAFQFKDICPICFQQYGWSIVLEEKGDELVCPRDPHHRFRKTKDGRLEKI